MATSNVNLKPREGTFTLKLTDSDLIHIQEGGVVWFRDFKLPNDFRITVAVKQEAELVV
jgi:hypothetical protein